MKIMRYVKGNSIVPEDPRNVKIGGWDIYTTRSGKVYQHPISRDLRRTKWELAQQPFVCGPLPATAIGAALRAQIAFPG